MSLWPCMLPMLWYWGWNICSFVCLFACRSVGVCVRVSCAVLSGLSEFSPFFSGPFPTVAMRNFPTQHHRICKCCCPLGCYYFKFLFSVVFFSEFFFCPRFFALAFCMWTALFLLGHRHFGSLFCHTASCPFLLCVFIFFC